MRKTQLAIIAQIVLLALFLQGCAQHNARTILVVSNVTVEEGLTAVQGLADTLLQTKQITLEQRQQIGKYLLPALETGRKLAQLTRDWPTGKPAPPEMMQLARDLGSLVDQALTAFPDTSAKSALATKIAIAQNAALALALTFVR